ncbi:unnamed protein product [Urochloa humidicola]
MADIALLVVEEFERGTKRAAALRRGNQELTAGDGDDRLAASAYGRSKKSSWASASAAGGVARADNGGALGLAAADGFFSA